MQKINFKALFEEAHGSILVLNPSFTILAISDAFIEATYTKREDLVGKYFFDVFQDTKNTTAVAETKASLEYVLKNKKPHLMPMLRMEIKNLAGVVEEKYWNPINKPILTKDNKVQYIIHIVKELTEFVKLEKIYVSEENISNTLPDLIHSLESTLLNRQKKSKSINEKLHQKIVKQNIELENLTKDIYYFDNRKIEEKEVIKEFQNIAGKIATDKDSLGEDYDTAEAVKLDNMPLSDYIKSLECKQWLKDLFTAAFVAEFGLDCNLQSTLNFLDMIDTDTSEGFKIFGESDERYRVKGGNSKIIEGLEKKIGANKIEKNSEVSEINENTDGSYSIIFKDGKSN
jgi:hypothetical protein